MLSTSTLAYLMGPIAFVIILFLVRFNVLARESMWLWLGVFVAIPVLSLVCNRLYRLAPTPRHLHIRVAASAASVTAVIYLTGWGPVLVLAFAFLVLENIAVGGSRVWRTTALWSLIGIGAGQVAVWQHWAPSFLATSRANALALMGAVVLLFVIRTAGVVMEQKEKAEASMRLSEDRFRSLIQNSSDMTVVIDGEGRISYVSPVVTELLGFEPGELVGRLATDLVHRDDKEYVRNRFGVDERGPVLPPAVPHAEEGRHLPQRRSRDHRSEGSALHRRLRRQRARHHRAQGVRGPSGPPGPARFAHRLGQPAADG